MMAPLMNIDIGRALAIDGFMKPCELVWLAENAAQARVVVEVGCYKGRSTRALADHCPGIVYAVDPWCGTYPNDSGRPHGKIQTTEQLETFKVNLAPHIESGRVVPVISNLGDAIQENIFANTLVDLVFIDGDHREPFVISDINNALTILRPGGILSGHDYGKSSWPGVKRAVDERFASTSVSRCHTIWWVRV